MLNAVQAIGNKGEVNVRIMENSADIVVIVEDTGPGVPKELMNQIFDPLFTTKQLGTGLGLSICKNIVEQHGGNISLKNDPTTFMIRLPKNF